MTVNYQFVHLVEKMSNSDKVIFLFDYFSKKGDLKNSDAEQRLDFLKISPGRVDTFAIALTRSPTHFRPIK
jgi:hypothetical protein